MDVDWGIFWGAFGGIVSTLTLALVILQEVRQYRSRPLTSWGVQFDQRPNDEITRVQDGSTLTIVNNGDQEVRNLQIFGRFCELIDHEDDHAVPVMPPGSTYSCKVLPSSSNSEQPHLVLVYHLTPFRQQKRETAWLPICSDTGMDQGGDFELLPWFRKLHWRWKHRKTIITRPGGPRTRRFPARSRRRIIRQARIRPNSKLPIPPIYDKAE